MSRPPPFRQVSIVGLGLIGGSLGMALRKGRLARKVIGFSRHEATVRRAVTRGAIDDGDTELCPDWLGHSDLVVIATPPLAVVPTARKIAKITTGRIILTDVASTKAEIVRALDRELPPRISFVGGHPMAGSEQSGIHAASATLFRNALCLLTPTARTDRKALEKVKKFWRLLECRIQTLSPQEHDQRVAEVSHLPHLAAAALSLSPQVSSLCFAGPGFADATRIGAGDPALWEEICRTNAQAIVKALNRFIVEMNLLRNLVGKRKSVELKKRLEQAHRRQTGRSRG